MKIKNIIYTVLMSFCFFSGMAQKALLQKAEKQYDNYAYADAISIYEKLSAKGYKDEKMFQRLGNAYYFNAELTKAVVCYDELFFMNPKQEPEYFYRYAQSLKAVEDYA